jgi:hypothetical protein
MCCLLSTYTPYSFVCKVSRYIRMLLPIRGKRKKKKKRIITTKAKKSRETSRAIVEQHTTAPLRYIPHRNGFNELSLSLSLSRYTILHRVLSEQSIVYGTRRPNRRAGLLFIPLPRNRRAHTHTQKQINQEK